MKKIIFLVAIIPAIAYSQVLNHQSALPSKAERHLQFKISDAPNDVLEIGNSTSLNNQFQPTIWAHKESSNVTPLALTSHITSVVDNGAAPLINLNAGIGIFDNGAPNTSQFPWGDGSSTLPIVNRPILGVNNATTRLFTVSANGNIGIGITTPLAKLHTIGTVRHIGLSTLTSGCLLYINPTTGEIGRMTGTLCRDKASSIMSDKAPIVNALEIVTKIDTYEAKDSENNVDTFIDSGKTKIADGDYQKLIPYLLESIKELNVKIEDLESQLNAKNGNLANNNASFKVLPNPVKDILTVYFDNSENKNYTVNIFDTSGNKIANKSGIPANNMMSINLSNLAAGVYVYEIAEKGSKTSKKGKLIKE